MSSDLKAGDEEIDTTCKAFVSVLIELDAVFAAIYAMNREEGH